MAGEIWEAEWKVDIRRSAPKGAFDFERFGYR